MAEFTATVDDTASLADSALGEMELLRVVDDTASLADSALGEMELLRVVDDTASLVDSVSLDASNARSASDSIAVSDALSSSQVAVRSFSDAVTLSDDVDVKALIVEDAVDVSDSLISALSNFTPVISDTISATDSVLIEGVEAVVAVNDTVSISDSIDIGFVKIVTRADSLTVTEQVARTATFERAHSESVSVVDALVSAATIAFAIAEAHALSESRVRVTFAAPALNNAALSEPANYLFDNVSSGTVDVTPLSVFIPPGQPQPLYVEIDTSEHTNAGTYQVALSAAIRGAAGEYGDGVPYPYVGIGVAPQIAVVIATSPIQVEVHFTEAIADNYDARSRNNYKWTNGLHTLAVVSVIGEVVTLQTTAQVPGALYILTVTATEPLAADVLISDDIDVDDALDVLVEPISVTLNDAVDVVDDVLAALAANRLVLVVGNYVAPSGVTGVQSSHDGVTWSDEAPSFFAPEGRPLYEAVFGNELNVIVGGAVAYRSDGHGTWAAVYGLGDSQGIAYSPSLGIFVISNLSGWMVSADAISWTYYTISLAPFSSNMKAILWVEDLGLFVSGGDYYTGRIWTSPDGVNWTGFDPSTPFGGRWHGIAWNAGAGLLAIAGGDSGDPDNLQTSPDGVNWTRQTPGGGYTGPWRNVAASATRFVVVGYDSAPHVQTSDDGVTWTPQTFAGGYSGQPRGLTYREDLGLFVMSGTGGEIQTSPDGVTWTHRALGGGVTDANFNGAA